LAAKDHVAAANPSLPPRIFSSAPRSEEQHQLVHPAHMKLFTLSKVTALVAAAALAVSVHAEALIHGTFAQGQDLIMGAIPAAPCYITGNGIQWQTQTGLLQAGTNWSAGITAGTEVDCRNQAFQVDSLLKNASFRGTISSSQTLQTYFYTHTVAPNTFSFSIWGPTLNQFGLVGATNFRWLISIYDDTGWHDVYWGSDETNNLVIPGTPQTIMVTVFGSDTGTVLPQINSLTNP
jgi:hypothetical protein